MMSSLNLLTKKIQNLFQILAVSYYLTEFGILLLLYPIILIYLLLFTKYWFIVLIYLIWYIYDYGQHERGGRQFFFIKNLFFWKYASQYFPAKLIRVGDESLYHPNRNYLFCLSPHGLFSLGTIFTLVTNGCDFSSKFKGLKQHILTVPAQVVSPIHREISLAMGYCSASKKSLLHILDKKRKGNVALLMIGGAIETIYSYKNSMNICIKSRKGFIKLAIQKGSPLVPVIVFGENNMYNVKKLSNEHLITKLQRLLANLFNVTFVFFKGRGIFTENFGLLPYRVPIVTIVGLPIEVEEIKNPTQNQIDNLHEIYIKELNKLYDQFNPIYGNKNVKLNII